MRGPPRFSRGWSFSNTACGSAVCFDSSNYHWAWQYSGSPDWYVFKEPAYLPLFGYKWGS